MAIKSDEMIVKADDFGFLTEEFIRAALRTNGPRWQAEWLDTKLREWWPKLEEYYQHHIMSVIEVAILLDEPPRYGREPLEHREMWEKIVKDLRPARSSFTIDYHCHKCKTKGVKLWRGVHGCSDNDGNELLCATCLAPGLEVDAEGKWQEPPYKAKDAYGKEIPGMRTDQVKGWLPAVPVGDTYWGYSSVPSQDIEWWVALPTYP